MRDPARLPVSAGPSARAWVAWLLVTFGLLAFAGTSHDETRRVFEDFGAGRWHWSAASTVRAVRVYLTNERDEQRYLAYLNAWLGRPYQPYFVRPLEAWHGERVAREVFIDTDAAAVQPAQPLVPYRDFLVEYPPGFFVWATPPALLFHGLDAYVLAFALWMALLMTAALWLCLLIARRPAFAAARPRLVPWMAASVFALGVVVTHRYDASVALLLCLAAWAALERRPVWLGVAIGLATATKATPLLVAPPIVFLWVRERRWRLLIVASLAAAGTALAVVVPFLIVAGQAVFEAAGYHVGRPLQIESTAAALVALVARGSTQVVQSHGSVNLIGTLADRARAVCGPLSLAAIVASYAVGARELVRAPSDADRERTLVAAMLAPLAAFMLTAKVFSPQYLVWLLPLALLSSLARPGGSRWLWLAMCLASQIVYPAAYGALMGLAPWMCLLLLARNVSLGVWAWLALRPRSPATGQTVRA